MTQEPFDQYSTGTTPDTDLPPTGTQDGTGEVAKQEARAVGHDAKEGAAAVAETAKAEIQDVAGEAKAQAANLFAQVRGDVTGKARDQQQRAAGGLLSLAGEFDQMARQADGSGMASGLVQQVSGQLESAASWLESREPADLLDDVRRYARRNPGTFLGICALAGLVGGRLTRGLRDDAADQQRSYTPGRTTYQPVADAGVYAEPTGVSTAYSGYGTVDVPDIPAGTTTAGYAPGADGYAAGGEQAAYDTDTYLPGSTAGSDEDRLWDEDGERR